MKLTTEQLECLQAFKTKHGRQWKAKLRELWMRGTDANEPQGHLLRQVRNRVSPSGLDRVQV